MADSRLGELQDFLWALQEQRTLVAAKRVVKSVVSLIVPSANESEFRLFTDSDGKLTTKASWFLFDDEVVDRRATYTLGLPESTNLDVKVFGVAKPNAKTISWTVGLTPNFEDEPFNGRFNVGIDFIIPESKDSVIVALSKNYVIRTIELKGKLTPTFLSILDSWTSVPDTSRKREFHEVLWDSLDLQPINKKFYEGINQRFISLRQHFETNQILDAQRAAQFANRLIGRLIFTWFLDKKELLDTQAEYFNSTAFDNDTEYYRNQLEPLFFEVLNTPVQERSVLDVTTPYLNGGLFDPKPEDLYGSPVLSFPRNYFDDLYEFLRGYNFTTDESTSDFQQVAIDPEMLGRIFENLLAEVSEDTGEQARKAKGAFYTPREIVDFMCRESLKTYLRSRIRADENLESRLVQLVDATEREFHDQDKNWRRDLKPYKEEILGALDQLKVIDPACGSGAFPIGMMQLLVKVYERLEPRFDHHKAKLSIIEKNIYGVDIEPMAVEISRLRAWLALVVDEEASPKNVKPLPNLDFKFVAANSLVGLEPLGQISFFEDQDLDSKLQRIRESYFKTESSNQKSKLREKYKSLVQQEMTLFGESKRTSQLKSFQPFESDSEATFFDPEQMFGFNSFDIVVGNPPYVRQEKIGYKTELSDYKLYQSTSDLYTYFYELGIRILRPGGVLSFITSSKFGRALYGEKLRKMLSSETKMNLIVDYGSSHVFSAITNTWVIQTTKEEPHPQNPIEVKPSIFETGMTISQGQLNENSWAFLDDENEELISCIRNTGHTILSLGYEINRGLLTGCNEAFVIDEQTKKALVEADERNSELVKPLLRGRDIGHYEIRPVTTWILVTKNGIDVMRQYPTIAAFLESKNAELGGRPEKRGDKGSHWMNLRDCSYYDEMESEKVVWLELSDKNKFAFSTGGEYLLNGAWMMRGKNLKAILGILNSSLIHYYFRFFANSSGMGTTQWRKYAVEEFPVPDLDNVDHEVVKHLENLVDQRCRLQLKTSPQEVNELESQINQHVFELYGLNNDQIELVKSQTKD